MSFLDSCGAPSHTLTLPVDLKECRSKLGQVGAPLPHDKRAHPWLKYSETAVKENAWRSGADIHNKNPLGPMHPDKTESHRRKSTCRSITVSLLHPSFADRSPGFPHSRTPIRVLTFRGAAGAMAISWQTDRQNHIEVRGEPSGLN
jgi:hypothetical protein